MIVDGNVIFIYTNILPSLSTWTKYLATVNEQGFIVLEPNGYIECNMQNSLGEGLKPCKFMRCVLNVIDEEMTDEYNYQNMAELITKFDYINLNQDKTSTYDIVPLIRYGSLYNDQTKIRTVSNDYISMNQTIESGSVKIRNNTDHNVIVVSAQLYRSNDLVGQLEGVDKGGEFESPTELDILCDRSNWTIDTIDDIINVKIAYPVDWVDYTFNTGPGWVWRLEQVEGYPNGAVIFGTGDRNNAQAKTVPVRGVRNGKIRVRATWIISPHAGESVAKEITIINCDPVDLIVSMQNSNKVNGWAIGAIVEAQVSPHKWYTKFEYERMPDPPTLGEPPSGPIGFPNVLINSLSRDIRLKRGDTVDGGWFSFSNIKGVYTGSISDGDGNDTIYGIFDGFCELVIDADQYCVTYPETTIENTRKIAVEVENSAHTVELIPSIEEIKYIGEEFSVIAITEPRGCPAVIFNNVFPWNTNAPVNRVGYDGSINEPYIIYRVQNSVNPINYMTSIELDLKPPVPGQQVNASVTMPVHIGEPSEETILLTDVPSSVDLYKDDTVYVVLGHTSGADLYAMYRSGRLIVSSSNSQVKTSISGVQSTYGQLVITTEGVVEDITGNIIISINNPGGGTDYSIQYKVSNPVVPTDIVITVPSSEVYYASVGGLHYDVSVVPTDTDLVFMWKEGRLSINALGAGSGIQTSIEKVEGQIGVFRVNVSNVSTYEGNVIPVRVQWENSQGVQTADTNITYRGVGTKGITITAQSGTTAKIGVPLTISVDLQFADGLDDSYLQFGEFKLTALSGKTQYGTYEFKKENGEYFVILNGTRTVTNQALYIYSIYNNRRISNIMVTIKA